METVSPLGNSSLEKEAGWLFVSDFISMISGLVGQAILVWTLAGEEYGLFVIALDTCFTILVLLDTGLSARVTRDVGKSQAIARQLVRKVVRFQIKLGLILGFLAFLILREYWGLDWFFGSIFLIVGISMHIISMTHRGALRSIGLAKHEAASRIIERVGATSAYLVLAFIGISNPEYFAIFAGFCFVLGGSYSIIQWKKNSPDVDDELGLTLSLKQLIMPAIPFALGYWLLTVNYRLPKIILGNIVSFSEVGIFNIAMIGFLSALAVPNAIKQSCQPQFSRELGPKGMIERRGIFRSSRRMARAGVVFGLPAALLAGFIGFPVIFPNAAIVEEISLFEILTILLVGWTSILLTSPDWGKVMGDENPIGYSIAMVVSVSAQIIGSIIFGANFGLEEAAMFFSVGAVSSSIVFLYCTAHTEGSSEVIVGMMEYLFGMAYSIVLVISSLDLLLRAIICVTICIIWYISVEEIFKKYVQKEV